MSLPARHIGEPFLRISIRQTNRSCLGQVSSEARPVRRNALLSLLQSRPLRPWTRGQRTLRSVLPHLFLQPMLADRWAILDPHPPLPWILLPYDDMVIQTTALVLSTSPNNLSTPILCCHVYQTSFPQRCLPQRQQSIVISLLSSALMGRLPPLWST